MCLEGPEGSITKAGTDPELQGGDVVMAGLWGIPSCSTSPRRERKKRWRESDGRREGRALRIGLQTLIERAFFILLPNTRCHRLMFKRVNTQEAYRETQTGLGIVMC